eukprot:Nitzschia sp. Nitz4//scaffold126_size65214//206//3751//NITZ4_006144-RA/size65214-augustus-gene-0.60-mRNA-1//1//CDS//3329534653//6005//frame0
MKTFSCTVVFLLGLATCTQADIKFRRADPAADSVVTSIDGSVDISVRVFESSPELSIIWAKLDLMKDGERQLSPLPQLTRIQDSDDFSRTVTDLEIGSEYCYRIKSKNSAGAKKRTTLKCFTIEPTGRSLTAPPTSTPTVAPTSSPTNSSSFSPSMTPSNNPSVVPSALPSASPSGSPSAASSSSPTSPPTTIPTGNPTASPTQEVDNSQVTYGLQADCYLADPSKFSICLDLTAPSGEIEPFMSHFTSARATWESAVLDNGIYFTGTNRLVTDYTATGSYPSIIDGLYIASGTSFIDGEYNILGYAGPVYRLQFKNTGNQRPLTGRMVFDAEDIDWMEKKGILKGVIEHEMGHVLGIGTLWDKNGLVDYPVSNRYYGPNVLREWKAQGCEVDQSGGAPIVEMDGGSGTAGGHFDEACFDKELMTGYADFNMVLSNLTMGSLADMGYVVDYSVAESYDFSGSCCTRRRRLGKPKRKRFSERRLTVENEKQAKAFGKKELKRMRETHEKASIEGPAIDPSVLGLVDTITVYVEQDGHVIDVDVSIDEEDIDTELLASSSSSLSSEDAVELAYQALGPIPDIGPPQVFPWEEHRLSEEEPRVSEALVRLYQQDGVIAIRGLLDPSLLDRLDSLSSSWMLEDWQKRNSKPRGALSGRPQPKTGSYGTQFFSVKEGAIFVGWENTTTTTSQESSESPLLQVALQSKIPHVAAQLLNLTTSSGKETLRLMRDIFLAKDTDKYICGWHVDDSGFWPATAESPGINAWVALDDMPVEGGGGFALAVQSHVAPWRFEAYNSTGSTHTLPPEGFTSPRDILERRVGNGTCNIETSSPHLFRRLEDTKRIYEIQKGDVIFHTRWLFHRTVAFESNSNPIQNKETSEFLDQPVYRRYTLRYGPGSSVIPPGYGTEPSVVWDSNNGGRTADEVAYHDAAWYPKAWPSMDAAEVDQIRDIALQRLPFLRPEMEARRKQMRNTRMAASRTSNKRSPN